jgi:hypothetical protein
MKLSLGVKAGRPIGNSNEKMPDAKEPEKGEKVKFPEPLEAVAVRGIGAFCKRLM